MKASRTSLLRLNVILLVGLAAGLTIELYRSSKRPQPAPRAVQEQGLAKIREIVAKVEQTDFGRTKRGALIIARIRALMKEGKVIMTHAIKPMGLYRTEFFGPSFLYLKVLRNSEDTFVLMDDTLMAGAIFHEAVHAIQEGESSIEEECDGYAAGLVAFAIIGHETIPHPLEIDGKPAALFIVGKYPELGRDPSYVPVGETRQWLLEVTGLDAE